MNSNLLTVGTLDNMTPAVSRLWIVGHPHDDASETRQMTRLQMMDVSACQHDTLWALSSLSCSPPWCPFALAHVRSWRIVPRRSAPSQCLISRPNMVQQYEDKGTV